MPPPQKKFEGLVQTLALQPKTRPSSNAVSVKVSELALENSKKKKCATDANTTVKVLAAPSVSYLTTPVPLTTANKLLAFDVMPNTMGLALLTSTTA
jgi:hypothetical protein